MIDQVTSAARVAVGTAAKVEHEVASAGTKLSGPLHLRKRNIEALQPGDVATGWGLRFSSVEAAKSAEMRGVKFLNDVDATLATHRKSDMATVLTRAGVPHVASGIPVRHVDEFHAAREATGGAVYVTGGFSQSRVFAYGKDVKPGIGGAPDPRRIGSDEHAQMFGATHLDRSRTFLVQPAQSGEKLHVVTAGGKVVEAIGGAHRLTAAERANAVRATDAYGLRTGGVDMVRGTDGVLRVMDVHSTPRIGNEAARAMLDAPTLARTLAHQPKSIAADVESEKVGIGLLNMGQRPGKNIGPFMAEIERQGARPVFLPAGATQVAGHKVLVGGKEQPLDAVINRAGSIISDDALGTLHSLEHDAKLPTINGAETVAQVRSKNTQAEVLHGAGVPHPQTMMVRTPEDAERAIQLIGGSMVLKNPASSEGRGVMFLPDADAVRGVTKMFEQMTADSHLVATDTVTGRQIAIESPDDAKRAVRELGDVTTVPSASGGVDQLKMNRAIRLSDSATGASVDVKTPVSVVTIGDAFRDAQPGAELKAETWYHEAAGVDTRYHVMADANGEHRVLAALRRQAPIDEYGDPRSNLALNGKPFAAQPTPEETKVAIGATKAFGLKYAGIDVIKTSDGAVALEANTSPGQQAEEAVGPIADKVVGEAVRMGAEHRAALADFSGLHADASAKVS